MRMMYKSGKQTTIWGIPVDYQIVEDYEIDAYLELGWVLHPFDLIKTPEPELKSVIPEVEEVKEYVAEPAPAVTKAKRGRKHVV